jgi:hypothetical protein
MDPFMTNQFFLSNCECVLNMAFGYIFKPLLWILLWLTSFSPSTSIAFLVLPNQPGCSSDKPCTVAELSPDQQSGRRSESIDELIDTNPKFWLDLQEYLSALICLSADEICQPFSWGGNFYVDSGIHFTELWFKTSMYKLHSNCEWKLYFNLSLWKNRDPHFLNLQDSTHPPCVYQVYTHAKETWMEGGGGRGPSERRLERQHFTRWVKNTNMKECISSLLNLWKTCVFIAGFRIRIDFMRIRIQHFF